MLVLLSVVVNFFAINNDIDHIKEPHKINKGPRPNSISGRITIIAPINPTTIAVHLLMPTCSLRNKIARIVEKIGTVNMSAVAFESSVIDIKIIVLN